MPQYLKIGVVIELLWTTEYKFAREGWNGKGQYIGLQQPDQSSSNTLPYIFIVTVDGLRVPWVASQSDLLAEDWFMLE